MSLSSLGSDWLGGERPDGSASLAGRLRGGRLLVPLLVPEAPAATDQLGVAAALSRARGSPLSVLSPVPVPEREPESPSVERALYRIAQEAEGGVVHTADVTGRVLRAVRESDVETVVVPGRGASLRRRVVRRVAAGAGCDVLVVNGRAGYGDVASVLLPVAGGAHSGLAADVARSVAADTGAWVDVLHVVDSERQRERGEALVAEAQRRIGRPETTTTWVLEADDVVETIVEQSRCYDLTVVGAPTKSRLRRFINGSTTRSVRRKAGSVVLSALAAGRQPTEDA